MARDAIHREAARWFTQLQAAQAPVEKTVLEWQQWMARDSRHTEAFARLEEVWDGFDALPRPALLPRDLVDSDVYDGETAVTEWNARRQKAGSRRQRVNYALAASFVLAVGIAGALWIADEARVETLDTRVGENRTVTLEDGSRITLGGRTRVRVDLDAGRREVTLSYGEALFSVAKDPARPFRVLAGSATVTAVGTEFNVRRSADRVRVCVLEGRVMVQPLRPAIPVPWLSEVTPAIEHGAGNLLDAGQQTLVDRDGAGATGAVADVSAAIGWQHGRLSFDDEPLQYAVAVVNRYSVKQIVIADPEIRNVRVSGTVLSGHIEGWVASLDAAFGVRAFENEDRIALKR